MAKEAREFKRDEGGKSSYLRAITKPLKQLTLNKRGEVGGIEMILSFTIFLGFLFFIFVYLTPLSRPVTISLLSNFERGVTENASFDLDVRGVAINLSRINVLIATKQCFVIPNPFNTSEVFVENEASGDVHFGAESGAIYIDKSSVLTKFYYIYNISEGKTFPKLDNCLPLEAGKDYTMGLLRTEKVYSYNRLKVLNQSYYSNYEQLKLNLKFPLTSDFSSLIYGRDSNDIIFNLQRPIPRITVHATEFPIIVLKDSKKIKATMRILAWE